MFRSNALPPYSASLPAHSRLRGVTLIELLVVVAIVVVIAALAASSYSQYLLRAHRAEGRTALMAVQTEQEKYRTFNSAYAADITALGLPSTSSNNRYTVSVSNATGETYVAVATATGAQAEDAECATMTVTQTPPTGACWQ